MSIIYSNVHSSKQKLFSTNIENRNVDTRQGNNLYLPQANVTVYQKGAYCWGIKIFNNLPMEIKNVADNLKKVWNGSKTFFVHLFVLYFGRIF